ncbi:hypothetical protein A5855_002134, partial [Enterococcus faecium]
KDDSTNIRYTTAIYCNFNRWTFRNK